MLKLPAKRVTLKQSGVFVCKHLHLEVGYRAVEPCMRFRTRRLRTPTCVWMRDRASQSHSLSQRRPCSGRGCEAEIVWHFNRLRGPLSRSYLDLPRSNRTSPESASPTPHPSKPHPCNMPQAKTEVALQFSECCAAETALQHRLFCSAEVIWTRSCAAANEKLHCNIEKAALQESGAFLPLSCGFQAPTFGHPRLGPADRGQPLYARP